LTSRRHQRSAKHPYFARANAGRILPTADGSTFPSMDTITWSDFERVELRVGTIIAVDDFPEARKPAWKLTVDFGELGTRRSSAQIAVHYRREDLLGRQVIAVVNFPPKQIGPFLSEVLVLGAYDAAGDVILLHPDSPVAPGSKILVTGFADENGAIVLALPERRVPNGAKLV
jgi:tRNA-binding protein